MSLMSDLGLAIKSKLDTKANINNPVFTGSVTLPSTTQIGTLTSTTIGYLDGITGNIQTQINSKLSSTGTAATATKLATARSINGVAFDGTANITIADDTKVPLNGTGASGTWGISITGNANTATSATKLVTARTIGGVSFDGTANINLPGVNTTGNQNTTGNAETVTNGVYTNSSQALNTDPLRIVDNTLYLYKGDGTSDSVEVASQKGTATVYGGAKFSLSGTTLTITTT